tara:strand:- start:59 stop:301 length:243 start_codon:yes stop_codon:yes gene_type:complete
MFENFGTALIQLVGFFGVFGFFIYQLLTDKENIKTKNTNSTVKSKDIKVKKELKSGLFGRRQKPVTEEPAKTKKNKWFQR